MPRTRLKQSAVPALLLPAILFCTTFSAVAHLRAGDLHSRPETDSVATHYAAIVKIDSEEGVGRLEEMGAEILRRRGDLLLCFIPLEAGEEPPVAMPNGELPAAHGARRAPSVGRGDGIVKIERRPGAVPALDKARAAFGADAITTGTGFARPYTGQGVVAGICDIGFDPAHVAFRDAGGSTRIAAITCYEESAGRRAVMDSEEEYRKWRTDNDSEYHATHVAGIFAGSYAGNPYHGTAPGTELVVSTSQLTDVGLLCGAEDILDYARSCGKPAVINMSMGNYTGPRDGTSLFSRYLDLIGREAIVVLSAGNEGASTNSLRHDFTDATPVVGVRLHNTRWTQFDMYGLTDAWSATDDTFRVRLCVYDGEAMRKVWESPWIDFGADGGSRVFASDGPDADAGFARYFRGYVSLAGGVSDDNNRFGVCAEYDAHTDATEPGGRWALYNLMLEYSGASGTHVDISSDAVYTRLREVPGYPAPGSELSFSDLATGRNVVSVGMSVSRDTYPLLSGGEQSGMPQLGETGHVSWYSSYATLADGRVMPLTVGPGASLVSACSRPYLDADASRYDETSAVAHVGDGEHYWTACCGTSMSSPFVAGVIATWLEADPTLTVDDVKEIIEETNRHDYPDAGNPRHGRGWIDPQRGLRRVLETAAAEDIDESSESRLRLTLKGRMLTIANPHSAPAELRIAAADGRTVARLVTADALTEIDLSEFTGYGHGMFIAEARAGSREPERIKFIL